MTHHFVLWQAATKGTTSKTTRTTDRNERHGLFKFHVMMAVEAQRERAVLCSPQSTTELPATKLDLKESALEHHKSNSLVRLDPCICMVLWQINSACVAGAHTPAKPACGGHVVGTVAS